MGSDEENNDQLLEQIRQLKEEIASLKEIRELKEQIASIHEQTTSIHKQTTSIYHDSLRTINAHDDTLLPPEVESQDTNTQCNCRCRYLVRGGTVVGRGVRLGMVFAGDVGDLSPEQLVALDNGLREIARHLIPPKAGSPPGTSAKVHQQLETLFAAVPVRRGITLGDSKRGFVNFRDPARSRQQRLGDGLAAWKSEPAVEASRIGALAYETVSQLLAFRGIDLDVAGN